METVIKRIESIQEIIEQQFTDLHKRLDDIESKLEQETKTNPKAKTDYQLFGSAMDEARALCDKIIDGTYDKKLYKIQTGVVDDLVDLFKTYDSLETKTKKKSALWKVVKSDAAAKSFIITAISEKEPVETKGKTTIKSLEPTDDEVIKSKASIRPNSRVRSRKVKVDEAFEE